MAGAPFVFRDYRGLLQLRLNTPEDLDHLHQLEPARWSSTSVPTDQLFCDKTFLEFIDTDQNKRVRVQELLAAHDWLRKRLKNKLRIIERTDTVYLDDLDTSNPDAAKLKALAEEHMERKGSGAQVTLKEIRAFKETYTKQFPNGDGVVTFAQVGDAELSAFASSIVKSEGGVVDLSGEIGIDESKLDAFIQHGLARLAWEADANSIDNAENSVLFPLGEATTSAGELILALSDKIDQFFAQCDLISQENAALSRFSASAETISALDINNPAAISAYLKEAPLARPNPAGVLDIGGWLNPLFAEDLRKLAYLVLPAVVSEGSKEPTKITRKEWEKITHLFDDYRAYMGRKPADLPDNLQGDELREFILGPLPERLRTLIAEDREASEELKAISDLEKLSLYQRWIVELANNMASFPYLFVLHERCLFETGTLVLDGRELSFCVRVNQKSEHKPIAEQSNLFVIYVDLERKTQEGATATMNIAAAVTSGVRRGISMGKRGIFYDREGQEWDARVSDIIVRPISLWEAAIAPFVRLRDFVLERIERWTESRFASAESKAQEAAESHALIAPEGLPAARPPSPAIAEAQAQHMQAQKAASHAQSLSFANLFFGSAISLAAIGSAAAFAIKTLSLTDPVNLLVVVCGIVAGIMLLSAFLGWLRLRKRDLSTLLEACGWAFNVRIFLRRKHSLRFTRIPPIPRKAIRERGAIPTIVSDEGRISLWRVFFLLLIAALLAAAIVYRAPLQAFLSSIFGSAAP